MERLNGYRMRLVLIGVVAAAVLSGGSAKADFTFGKPTNLGPPINSQYGEGASISPDGLTFAMESNRPGGQGDWDIWIATRETTDDPWGEPVNLGSTLNSPSEEALPQISPDGLELYFGSKRPGGQGATDVWVARRPTLSDPWGPATNVGPPINSSAHEGGGTMTADGLEFFFHRTASGAGGFEIWTTRRTTRDDSWDPPVKLGPTVNSPAGEICPHVSRDGLLLFFSHHPLGPARPGGYGGTDIWITARPTRDDPWGPPVNPGPPLNTAYGENCPSITGDGRWLYFSDWSPSRPGGYGADDAWKAPIIPIVDLNGDGIVDSLDMCTMVDHWGEDYSLCDIGPMPWGDGIVDIEDMKVLADYLFEDVNDPTLVAHWPLDETQGSTARDSVGGEGAFVMGDPLWQPSGGMVDGALQLDGVDDCVITTSGINPADGPFSVLAWINGGAPGQAIISQQVVSDWLILDAKGNLTTELKSTGRPDGGSLLSDAFITDGDWHRIGLVWDGSYRCLYVDGAKVANDTEPLSGLQSANRSLYICVGKDYTAGTFFAGLIDDVRIYNRVVSP